MTGRTTQNVNMQTNSTAERTPGSLHPAGSAEYAVEWNGGEGWKRLAQTKPSWKEAREYAEWVLVKDHQEYRIIEITEKILPNAELSDRRANNP